ncbi:MAG TPA: 2'-5' RNA ligase family protein [Motilibacteraceae bacterium]|nr:2'-5' RNA ligase family protein [Motilibacteraceae bacterium]
MPIPGSDPVFARLSAEGAAAILAGTHRRDVPPVDGGRWPVTVLARPPHEVRDRLEALMHEAMRHAGPGHFRTGRADSVHVTIRALEPFRAAADVGDPIVEQWVGALQRTAEVTGPFSLTMTGISLTASGVLARLEPDDDRPWRLMDRLRDELGDLAWFEEQGMRRNIWYSSLLHFTDDVVDPQGLVAWAQARRALPPLAFEVTALELVRFRHSRLGESACSAVPGEQGHYMRPESWLQLPLGGPQHGQSGWTA